MTLTSDARIEVVASAEDIVSCYDVTCASFGIQAADNMWKAFNPGYDTPKGRKAGAQRMVTRWNSITSNIKGDPNTVFLKATVPTEMTYHPKKLLASPSGFNCPSSMDMGTSQLRI